MKVSIVQQQQSAYT